MSSSFKISSSCNPFLCTLHLSEREEKKTQEKKIENEELNDRKGNEKVRERKLMKD